MRWWPSSPVALFVASLFVPVLACASPVRFGVALGPSFATLATSSHSPYVESFTSVTGEIAMRVPIASAFDVQAGIDYAVKGFSLGRSDLTDENGVVAGTFTTHRALTHLEVPLLLRWNPVRNAVVEPFLVAGPFVSAELDEAYHHIGAGGVLPARVNTHQYPNVDFGLAGGAGVRTKLGPGWLSLAARYDAGLKNLWPDAPTTAHSRFTALTLGYER